MADQDLQKLVVSFEARLDTFNRQMAKLSGDTDAHLSRVENRFKQAESSIASFGKEALAGFAAGLTIERFRQVVEQIANLADEAKKAGVSVEQFQKILFAGSQAGVSQEAIVASFSKLNLQLGQAITKGNDLGKILEANGKNIAALQRDPVSALKTIADLFRNAGNEADRAVIGEAAFGRGFRELVPLLAQGSAGIDDLMRRGQALGVVIDEQLIAKVEEFNKQIKAAGFVFEAGFARIIANSVGELERLVQLADALARALGGTGVPDDLIGALAGKAVEHTFGFPRVPFAGNQMGAPGMFGPESTGPATTVPVQLTEEQKQAERQAEAQAKKITQVIEALQRQRDNLTRTAREQEIYNELAKAGVDINSEAGKKIAELAGKFADEKKALHELVGEMDLVRDATKGFFGDLISGLRQGKSLTDALAQAFSNLADKMVNRLLDQAVDALIGKSGSSEFGALGSLFGIGAGTAPAALPGLSRNPYDVQRGVTPSIPILPSLLPNGATAPIDPVTGEPLPFFKRGFGGTAGSGVSGGVGAGIGLLTNDVNRAGKGDFGVTGAPVTSGANNIGIPEALAGMFGPLRRNNPGNIEFGPFAERFGGTLGAGGRFAQFPDATHGFQAMQSLLLDYERRGSGTVSQIVNRFAPPGPENQNNANYIGAVSRGVGVGPNEALNLAGNPQRMQDMLKSMTEFEQGVRAVGQTAQSSAQGFTSIFPQALGSVVSSIGGAGGGGFNFGSLIGTFLGGGLGAGGLQRASGGPVWPGGHFTVGENGPEDLYMGHRGGVVIPKLARPSGGGTSGGGMAIHVVPSPYFDVQVEHISGRGDARTLATARKSYPSTAARFQKLGTTTQ